MSRIMDVMYPVEFLAYSRCSMVVVAGDVIVDVITIHLLSLKTRINGYLFSLSCSNLLNFIY